MKKLLISIPILLVLLLLSAYMMFNNITDRIIEESLESETVEFKDKPIEPPPKNNTTATTSSTGKTSPNSIAEPIKTTTEKLTKEQVQKIKENITVVDKTTLVNMVLAKLTPSDIKELTSLAAGGLTPDERARAKQVAYSRFTQAEIDEIKELYYKYISTQK